MIFCRIFLFALLIAGTGTAAYTQQPAADPAESFLVTYWDSSRANRAAADQLWEEIGGEAVRDPELLLAFLANQVNHHRYDAARKTAQRLTRLQPAESRGWILKIWLDAVVNEYDVALSGIRELKIQMERDGISNPAIQRFVARQLGSLLGYLETPVADRVNPNTLAAVQDLFPGNWDAATIEIFENARVRVARKFEELTQLNAGRLQVEAEQTAIDVAMEKDRLQRDRIALRGQLENLVPARERIAAEATEQVTLARQKIEPIQQSGADVSARIGNREQDVLRLNRELVFFQSLDPFHPSIPFVIADLRQTTFDLNSLYSEARRLDIELAQAQANLARTERQFEARLNAIDQQMEQIGKTLERNVADENKLDRKPLVRANKRGALAERERSLTTYSPFPIEILKQDLLREMKHP